MNVAAFDQWRADYDRLTYQEQIAFYDQVEHDHPAQNSYRQNWSGWLWFFDYVLARLPRPRVLEIGGWHGEMAAETLERYQAITAWNNYEISHAAVDNAACTDSRYRATVPYDYVWNITLPAADVLIACHVLEHIRQADLERLLDNLPASVRFAGIEMPIPEQGVANWAGYHGSHIFEAGWQEAQQSLALRGFKPIFFHNDLRGYER